MMVQKKLNKINIFKSNTTYLGESDLPEKDRMLLEMLFMNNTYNKNNNYNFFVLQPIYTVKMFQT